jgi:nitrogen fixation NifU-like protein
MDDLYRDEILEHYRNPHNFGTLDEPTTVKEGANPLCGDRITLMLGIDESGHVNDVKFTGRGCAISQASASMLTDEIKGKSLDDVAKLGKVDVLDNLGIEISPARMKCALLSLETLHGALEPAAPKPAPAESRSGESEPASSETAKAAQA